MAFCREKNPKLLFKVGSVIFLTTSAIFLTTDAIKMSTCGTFVPCEGHKCAFQGAVTQKGK